MLHLKELNIDHYLSSSDISSNQLIDLLDLAEKIKNRDIEINLDRKVLGLIFDKASTRTRVSFQVAMSRMGGTTVDLNPITSQLGRVSPEFALLPY